MKQALTIFLFAITIGVLNAAIAIGTVSAIKPAPVDGVATNYTLTVGAGHITEKTKIYFHTADTGTPATDVNCEVKPEAADISVLCLVTLTGSTAYKITVGSTVQTVGTVAPIAKKIKSINPVKAEKDTDATIVVTTEGTFAAEKFQFTTGYLTTDATTPTPATCTNAADNKSTSCAVKFTENGIYNLFIDQVFNGNTVTVSSGFLSLSLGILVALFLF